MATLSENQAAIGHGAHGVMKFSTVAALSDPWANLRGHRNRAGRDIVDGEQAGATGQPKVDFLADASHGGDRNREAIRDAEFLNLHG